MRWSNNWFCKAIGPMVQLYYLKLNNKIEFKYYAGLIYSTRPPNHNAETSKTGPAP